MPEYDRTLKDRQGSTEGLQFHSTASRTSSLAATCERLRGCENLAGDNGKVRCPLAVDIEAARDGKEAFLNGIGDRYMEKFSKKWLWLEQT